MGIEGIYIDDSGNPGADSPSVFLSESRKSWAAIIIPPSVSDDLETAMSIFLRGVKEDFHAAELHFTDIYSGRGIWKNVSINKRIEIFDLMALCLEKFSIPVLYQTFSNEFRNDHKDFWDSLSKLGLPFWDFRKAEHIGFWLLLIETKDVLKRLRLQASEFNYIFQIYVDEGLSKKNSQRQVPLETKGYFQKSILFQDSKSNVGLQIADFVAFVISKGQRILFEQKAGTEVSRAQAHILSIVAKLNHWTIDLIPGVDGNKFSKEGYEFLLKKDRKEKGLPLTPKMPDKGK